MSDANTDAGAEKYWYNTKTKQVEQGRASAWENRMGPYDTAEEAHGALARAAENSADWEAEDRDWKS